MKLLIAIISLGPFLVVGALVLSALFVLDETRPYLYGSAILLVVLAVLVVIVNRIDSRGNGVGANQNNSRHKKQRHNMQGLLSIPRLIKIVKIHDRYYMSIRNVKIKKQLGIKGKNIWNRLGGNLTKEEFANYRKQTDLDLPYLIRCNQYRSSSINTLKKHIVDLPFLPKTKKALLNHINKNHLDI